MNVVLNRTGSDMKGNKEYTKEKPAKKDHSGKEGNQFLVLHNDDHNTFEYVINCLIEVCGHDAMQAEQCTYLVHFKGSCDVLKGGYSHLVPYRNSLAGKDLKVTIE